MRGMKAHEVIDHVEQAAGKIRDVMEVHLPAIAAYMGTLQANPIVTAVESSLPGELSADAMVVLNGLFPLLGALGGRFGHEPPAGAVPAGPAPAPMPEALAASGLGIAAYMTDP